MPNIIPFTYNTKQVRVIEKDGEPWFVAKDVCDILEISNGRDAVSRLDDDEKDAVGITDAIGREQQTTIISESGVYALVFTSRKPEAEQFKRWIRKEVLPSIRKHGAYMTPQKIEEVLLNPDTIIQLATELKKEFALLRKKKIIRSNNTPYQEYIDRGYFAVKEKPIKMGDASFNYAQTFVTPKGVDYIARIIEAEKKGA
jgi:prophage antirepressor-like protein